jgi:alginate O-acetyltransferase complex protein AlgI
LLFSSPTFVLFFCAYLLLHVLLPPRLRLALIIVGSTIFYGYWNPYYVWLPFALMLIAYWGAIMVSDASSAEDRKCKAAVVIVALLLPLLAVKYTNFIYQDVIGLVAGQREQLLDWKLPLGISFITFTLIAYVVEVYSGRYRVEKSVGMLMGLVLFFPHLIAGPILRPAELLPQLHRPKRRLGVRTIFGIAIFSVGLIKKLVFADPLAEVVDLIFRADASGFSMLEYLLGIYAFSAQIYCDFSGYTDMAIGTAIMLGVKLPKNFQRPYVSESLVEFWARWHITLSKWLRDYLYIPLGGNRQGLRRQLLNLNITMALGGLWHGASWNFVVWGVAHGLGISFVHAVRELKVLRWLGTLPRSLKIFVTFHFVTLCWIPFRSPDLVTTWRVIAGPIVAPLGDVNAFLSEYAFPLALIGVFLFTHRWDEYRNIRSFVQKTPRALLWPVLAAIWILAVAVSSGSSAKFIYFDF